MKTKSDKSAKKSTAETTDKPIPPPPEANKEGEVVPQKVRQPILETMAETLSQTTSDDDPVSDANLVNMLKSIVNEALAEREKSAGNNQEQEKGGNKEKRHQTHTTTRTADAENGPQEKSGRVDNTFDSGGKHTGQSKGADNTSDSEGQRTGIARCGDYTSDSEGEITNRSRRHEEKENKEKSRRGVDKSPDAEHRGRSRRPKVYEISESEPEISHKRRRSTSPQRRTCKSASPQQKKHRPNSPKHFSMEDDINDFLGNSEAEEEPDTQDDW